MQTFACTVRVYLMCTYVCAASLQCFSQQSVWWGSLLLGDIIASQPCSMWLCVLVGCIGSTLPGGEGTVYTRSVHQPMSIVHHLTPFPRTLHAVDHLATVHTWLTHGTFIFFRALPKIKLHLTINPATSVTERASLLVPSQSLASLHLTSRATITSDSSLW